MRLFKSIYSPLPTGEGLGERLLSLFLILFFFASCSQESMIPSTDAEEIHLSGDIGSLSTSTVTRGAIDQDYAQTLSVSFARIDQNEDGTYPDYTTVAAPLAATRAGGAGQKNIGFTQPQYYLTRQDNNSTKLLGWHPATGTYKQADATVTFDISAGTADLMFTDEVTGNKVDKFGGAGRTFTFSHLLTKVSVKAFGDADSKDTWGAIKSVKVEGQPTSCVVALADRTATWSDSADLLLKKTTDDTAVGNVSLASTSSTATADCGYAMLRPTTGNTLSLIVETERGGIRKVTITLPLEATPQYFAAGTGYTVTLEFKSSDIIPLASIAPWQNGGNTSGSFPNVE